MYNNLKNFLTPMHVSIRILRVAQAKHYIFYILIVLQIKLTFCFINLLFYLLLDQKASNINMSKVRSLLGLRMLKNSQLLPKKSLRLLTLHLPKDSPLDGVTYRGQLKGYQNCSNPWKMLSANH